MIFPLASIANQLGTPDPPMQPPPLAGTGVNCPRSACLTTIRDWGAHCLEAGARNRDAIRCGTRRLYVTSRWLRIWNFDWNRKKTAAKEARHRAALAPKKKARVGFTMKAYCPSVPSAWAEECEADSHGLVVAHNYRYRRFVLRGTTPAFASVLSPAGSFRNTAYWLIQTGQQNRQPDAD